MSDRARGVPGSSVPAESRSRRRFLAVLGSVLLLPEPALAGSLRLLSRAAGQGVHPEPRPGVDGARVLGAEQLRGAPQLVRLFDAVRAMPQIADGLRCWCGCADVPGYRSLLSCYEGIGMAQHCEVCQGEARLAHGRWQEGQTLEQIRRAIDARYGPGATSGAGPGPGATHRHG